MTVNTGQVKFGTVNVRYYSISESNTTTYLEQAPIAAGSYQAVFYVTGTDNYTGLKETVAFNIEGTAMEISLPSLATGLVYNGNSQNLVTGTASVVPEDATVKYYVSSNGSEPDGDTAGDVSATADAAGTYSVYYKVTAPTGSSYESTDWTLLGTVEIAEETINSEWYTAPEGNKNIIFTGYAQELINKEAAATSSKPENLTLRFEYSLDNKTWSDSVPTASDIGSYYVYYKVSADNYKDVTGYVESSIISPNYTVYTSEYVPGHHMVYVFTDSDNVYFSYDNKVMYNIDALGYKLYKNGDLLSLSSGDGFSEKSYAHVYAYLCKGAYDSTKLKAVKADNRYQNNQNTILLRNDNMYNVNVDVNDEVYIEDTLVVKSVYNIANHETYLSELLPHLFRADVNKDGQITIVGDAALIRSNYNRSSASN
jgi:hypothetical protein